VKLADNRAVTEVLGEVLLLVIVVLLAAAFANYSTILLPSIKNVPQSKFVGKINGSNYTITLQMGEPIQFSGLSVVVVYNYTTNPETHTLVYQTLQRNEAIFESNDGLKAYLYLRNGWYNRSWTFGEYMNIPKKGNYTIVSVIYDNSLVGRLHIVG